MGGSIRVAAPLTVTFGQPPIRLIDGPYSYARISNTGNAPAWLGQETAIIGLGIRIRPLESIDLPTTDPLHIFVVAEPGNARMEMVVLSES